MLKLRPEEWQGGNDRRGKEFKALREAVSQAAWIEQEWRGTKATKVQKERYKRTEREWRGTKWSWSSELRTGPIVPHRSCCGFQTLF